MNAPIARLFVVVVRAVRGARRLHVALDRVRRQCAARQPARTAATLLEEQQIRRGSIRAADGTVLARSLTQPDGSYVRTYPTGRLFAHAGGLQLTCARAAPGSSATTTTTCSGARQRARRRSSTACQGSEQAGDDLVTTLDPAAQRVALQQLAGRKGAVVALDPRTGAVKVMASRPGLRPQHASRTSSSSTR